MTPDRTCLQCGYLRNISEFHKNSGRRGVRRVCKSCVYAKNRAHYHANKVSHRIRQKKYETKILLLAKTDKVIHSKRLVKMARVRAKVFGVPFNITYRDVVIPDTCPVLGIPIRMNDRCMGPDSVSLDRIIPSLGYVVGNVIIVSMKANLIKTNATPDEILAVGMFYKNLNDIRIATAS